MISRIVFKLFSLKKTLKTPAIFCFCCIISIFHCLDDSSTNANNSTQPEAIRKLLTGTVSPVVSMEKKIVDDTRYHPVTHDVARTNGTHSSPHGFKIGGFPKKERSDNRNRNLRDSPVQIQIAQKNQMGEMSKQQFRPFSPAQNSPKFVNGEAAYKPHHYRAFSPSDDKKNKFGRLQQENKQQTKNAGHYTPKKNNTSTEQSGDFVFSSPIFSNFKLNFNEILTAQLSAMMMT